MKMINKSKILVIVALLLITTMVASAEESPSIYFVPADGTGTCEEVAQIDLMINTSGVETGVQAQVNFDPACLNITAVDFTGCPWQPLTMPGWGNYGDNIRLAYLELSGVPDGVHKVATMTVDCICCDCVSDIELNDIMPNGYAIYNTTFTCSPAETTDVAEISIGDGTGVVTIPIVVSNATNVGSCHVILNYDPSVVNVVNVTGVGMDNYAINDEHLSEGWVGIGGYQGSDYVLSGQFILANVEFEPNGSVSSCPLTIDVMEFKDATNQTNQISYTISNGMYSSSLNGDVDDDGVVGLSDAMLIAKYVVGLSAYQGINTDAADVTGDGVIDISDAMYLAKHVIGIAGFEELR